MQPAVFEFTFLRHGESVGNAEERFQGQTDYPLTEAGRAQARALAERWLAEGLQFDLALTSPLARARETAGIIAGQLQVPLEADAVWLERDNGGMSGMTREEALKYYPQPDFLTPHDPFGDTGEGDWELFLRAGKAVHELLRRPAGRYLIVSHGGLLNKVLYAIFGIAPQANYQGPSFRFGNTGFAMFSYVPSRHQWRLLQFESPRQE
jgi:broad specificity phosphatase PhoE